LVPLEGSAGARPTFVIAGLHELLERLAA